LSLVLAGWVELRELLVGAGHLVVHIDDWQIDLAVVHGELAVLIHLTIWIYYYRMRVLECFVVLIFNSFHRNQVWPVEALVPVNDVDLAIEAVVLLSQLCSCIIANILYDWLVLIKWVTLFIKHLLVNDINPLVGLAVLVHD